MTKPFTTILRRLWDGVPVVLTVCLLGGVAVDRLVYHLPPADSEPYHERVRATAHRLPYNIGLWLGSDVEVPAAATELLDPNAIVSRSYQHVATGKTCSFLLVQCKDARDLLGHYPPVCYASQGWAKQDATPKDWEIEGTVIPAMRYHFMRKRLERVSEIRVENFMILPDGQFCRDMSGVETSAQDYRRKFFGAAQIQVITDAGVGDAEREQLFRQFIGAAKPLIDEIRAGVRS